MLIFQITILQQAVFSECTSVKNISEIDWSKKMDIPDYIYINFDDAFQVPSSNAPYDTPQMEELYNILESITIDLLHGKPMTLQVWP